jgi:hypothetical protein
MVFFPFLVCRGRDALTGVSGELEIITPIALRKLGAVKLDKQRRRGKASGLRAVLSWSL